ncbi:MAG: quinol:cytochrome C oxidoreductase, partial [Cyclobacteriaceae bacterium]|nr:quinol:cytochrome C oxidoreductase [Cyclobacteriaceae bacterium]
DWVMSIDPHWFSTMFGWYVFASWWVTGLAFITLSTAILKKNGYLKMINANHLHDLGKFVFAFSIFWTYIWFSQFLLIYYVNIPEETVYFIQRLTTSPYSWIFFVNLIFNFLLPFLLFMTRDSKRQISLLMLVCPIVLVGHWFDFYLMINPGVMKEQGGVGFMEIGMTLLFGAAFIYVMLSNLSKVPLVAKNHPFMEESLHHHI